MDWDNLIPITLFAMVVLIIWIATSARTAQRQKLLDVIEKAIEKGVDPASLPLDLDQGRGDPHGNWKAGVIMVACGLALAPLMAAAYVVSGEGEALPALTVPLLPIVLGVGFMVVHKMLYRKNGGNGKS